MGMQMGKAVVDVDVKLTGEAQRVRNQQLRHERLLRQAISDLGVAIMFGSVIIGISVVLNAIIGAS